MKLNFNERNGITLIALVITVVVFLILAGVAILTLTGENGILTKAGNAKQETEIGEEKENIKLAWSATEVNTIEEQKTIEAQMLQKEMDKIVGNEKSDVISCAKETFIVIYLETNRSYKVGKNMQIEQIEGTVKAEDSTPGELEISTEEEKTYIINSIEDLLQLSYNVNGISVNENGTLGTKTSNSYSGYTIKLGKTLNFESINSYSNYKTTKFGDANNDGKVEGLMKEMLTGEGFLPIGRYGSKCLNANFDGQNYEIQNIYEDRTGNVGLFGFIGNNEFKNLGVTGTLKGHSMYAAGIITVALNSKIDYCYFNEEVTTDYPKTTSVAGILADTGIGDEVTNCYSKGEISGYSRVGGIVGTDYNRVIKIKNCYNLAKISGKEHVGGIIGWGINEMYNCYNVGEVSDSKSKAGGIIGTIGNNYKIEKCYYLNIINNGIGNLSSNITIKKSMEEIKSQEFIDELNTNVNTYIEENEESLTLLKWKKGENEYPTYNKNTNF